MSDKQIYEYAVIRLVPKVEREEFLNVGVIVFCKQKSYLEVKYQLDPDRITHFAKDLDIGELNAYLRIWDLIAQGDPQGGTIAEMDSASRFRWLTAPRSTIIQNSQVHVGRCTNPTQVLDDLFAKYVL